MRRIQQVIAVRHVLAAPESFDEVADERTARMPQDKAGTDGFGNAEQVKFFADFAVVALFGFFDFLEILSEFFLIGERGAVNTGQHRIGFLAPVIRTGNAGQFECADVAGVVHMGTAAEIDEIAELIKRDRFAFGDIREAFQLEVLFLFRQEFDCFLASEFETGKRELFCGEPGHFFFDFHQILRCQLGCSEIEVVVNPSSVLGPISNLTSGYSSRTAAAIRCDALCLMVSRGNLAILSYSFLKIMKFAF